MRTRPEWMLRLQRRATADYFTGKPITSYYDNPAPPHRRERGRAIYESAWRLARDLHRERATEPF